MAWHSIGRLPPRRIRETWRHFTDIDHELIAVSGIYADREAEGFLLLVEGGTHDFEHCHPTVFRKLEECCLFFIRRAHRDRVPVGYLPDMEFFVQVGNRTLRYVDGLNEPQSAVLDQAHRVEGCLERPWPVVDVALLMPADDRCPRIDAENVSDSVVGPLHLHTRVARFRPPLSRLDLGGVKDALTAAESGLGIVGQCGHEWIDFFDDKRPLAGAGLD